MARLTFNLLDYNTFYNNALGLGTATYAVTILFWCSVILLQVRPHSVGLFWPLLRGVLSIPAHVILQPSTCMCISMPYAVRHH